MEERRDFCLHIDGVNLLLFVHRPSIISARNRWIRESNCLDWCNAIKLGVGLKMEGMKIVMAKDSVEEVRERGTSPTKTLCMKKG